MLVASVMTQSVISAEPCHTAATAARVMRDNRFRHLPVLSDGQLLGIVSDRDLVATPAHTLVRDVMHRDVISVTPDTPVEVAARLIADNKIGALPVVDGATSRVVGIVSQTDLFGVLAQLLGGEGPNTRLELCLTDAPRQLATIAATAHERNIAITSLMTLPRTSHEVGRRVVLRIATIVAAPFVEALIKSGIHVDESRG